MHFGTQNCRRITSDDDRKHVFCFSHSLPLRFNLYVPVPTALSTLKPTALLRGALHTKLSCCAGATLLWILARSGQKLFLEACHWVFEDLLLGHV